MAHKYELAKWTEEDELCKLGYDLEASRVIRVVDFKNFIENWEEESIVTKNAAHERKLNDKYQHIYFLMQMSMSFEEYFMLNGKEGVMQVMLL